MKGWLPKSANFLVAQVRQLQSVAARKRIVGGERHPKGFAMNHTGRYPCRVTGPRPYQGRIQPPFGERVGLPRRLHGTLEKLHRRVASAAFPQQLGRVRFMAGKLETHRTSTWTITVVIT